MNTMIELTKSFKSFKERQDKVYQRNLHSEEYAKAKKYMLELLETKISKVRINIPPPYHLAKGFMKRALQKDMYENTLEGMLNWISDGNPELTLEDKE